MRRHALAAAILIALVSIGRLVADDWDFTPADYGNLTGGGGDLQLDADSDWVPPAIRDNLIKTLKRVLDPNLAPPSTDGVNIRDFYHGHIACPRPCDEAMRNAISALGAADTADAAKALGGASYNPVTEENLEAFVEAKRRSEVRTRDIIAKFFREDCVIIYHTYEIHSPQGMKVGDPRRNIRTPNSGEPGGFVPPDPNNSSSYRNDYCQLAQIAFLIDEQGKVHVTTGTTFDLSKVTGSPLQ